MQRVLYTLLLLTFFISSGNAMDCYNGRYKNKVFTDYTRIDNVVYATKLRSDGLSQKLVYDVYQPKNDTASNRPVIIFAHGGGYIDLLDQKSPDIVEMAIDLAERGYVVYSIEYREEPNPLTLFSDENMIKAVGRSLVDVRDAICSIIDTTNNYGNPYRIDNSKIILGGVSAGAVTFLHMLFLDSLSSLGPQYKQWILQIEPNAQTLLNNRFCGAEVLGLISISGAVLDTAWIKPNRAYPPLLLQHGTADPIIPYIYDHPFHIPALPQLYGSLPIDKRYRDFGLRSELETWVGYSHVPFIGGFNLEGLFSTNPLALIFNPYVLDSTKSHIAHFCYSLIDCDSRITGIRENLVSGSLAIYPNPSSGTFIVQLPKSTNAQQWRAELYDIAGKQIIDQEYPSNTETIQINEQLSPGLYLMKVQYQKNGESFSYTEKINIIP